jgi:hypothetical protein
LGSAVSPVSYKIKSYQLMLWRVKKQTADTWEKVSPPIGLEPVVALLDCWPTLHQGQMWTGYLLEFYQFAVSLNCRRGLIYEGVSKSSITKSTTTTNTRWEASQMVMAAKLTRLTHKISIQLHLVAESCTICSSHSRRLDPWKAISTNYLS